MQGRVCGRCGFLFSFCHIFLQRVRADFVASVCFFEQETGRTTWFADVVVFRFFQFARKTQKSEQNEKHVHSPCLPYDFWLGFAAVVVFRFLFVVFSFSGPRPISCCSGLFVSSCLLSFLACVQTVWPSGLTHASLASGPVFEPGRRGLFFLCVLGPPLSKKMKIFFFLLVPCPDIILKTFFENR